MVSKMTLNPFIGEIFLQVRRIWESPKSTAIRNDYSSFRNLFYNVSNFLRVLCTVSMETLEVLNRMDKRKTTGFGIRYLTAVVIVSLLENKGREDVIIFIFQ